MSRQTIILPQMLEIMREDYKIMKQCDFVKHYKIWFRTAIKLFWYKKAITNTLPEVETTRKYVKPSVLEKKDYSIFKTKTNKNENYYLEKWDIIHKPKSILDIMWVKSVWNIY